MHCEPPPQHFSLARARFPLRWARRQETPTAAAHEPRVLRRLCAPIIPAQARRSPAPEDFARSRRCFAGTSPLRTASATYVKRNTCANIANEFTPGPRRRGARRGKTCRAAGQELFSSFKERSSQEQLVNLLLLAPRHA